MVSTTRPLADIKRDLKRELDTQEDNAAALVAMALDGYLDDACRAHVAQLTSVKEKLHFVAKEMGIPTTTI